VAVWGYLLHWRVLKQFSKSRSNTKKLLLVRSVRPSPCSQAFVCAVAVRAIMTDLATTTTGVLTTNAAGALISVRSVPFCPNHLARLRGFDHASLDDKLVRVETDLNVAIGKFKVIFLDDQARPIVPAVPLRRMWVPPAHMRHACEYCLLVEADGDVLQMCGRCKTARYCNGGCQRADWVKHKANCLRFNEASMGKDVPLQQACIAGDVEEVRRLAEEEEVDVDKATTNGPTPLAAAASNGRLPVVRYLVEQGADTDKAQATSKTPLYMAAQSNMSRRCRIW
jgi:Ankyrin repeats (3 copies)/MYND finger